MRLLDLFCGAGGAAMGYHQAGFDEVVGVDISPQPNYPFEFVQADVMDPDFDFDFDIFAFDFIHASPPCQAYSTLRHAPGAGTYPTMIEATRALLLANSDIPHVIENVVGAPLLEPTQLCGSMFGLRLDDGAELRRHRLFETSFFVMAPTCYHEGTPLGVYGHLTHHRRNNNANRSRAGGWKAGKAEARVLMGIDWMTDEELTQAIPPAYTKFLGEQFLAQVSTKERR